ncbi:MAG: hypothetical protein ABI851_08890 [Saprospiraceae bacterium]
MTRVILTEPFMHHCEGSIFDLSDELEISNWDPDERVRDRINYQQFLAYKLPDDGKGKETLLLLQKTILCPESIFKDTDIKSGPCRITSISKSLETKEDPYYASPFPLGRGMVLLKDSITTAKNLISIDHSNNLLGNRIILKNRIDESTIDAEAKFNGELLLDTTLFLPGFYSCELFLNNELMHNFTFIKCFPLVIQFSKDRIGMTSSKTLW